MTFRTRLAIAVALLAFGRAAGAAIFYVSTSGSDDAGGTAPDTAWRTIGKAVASAGPGDTVYIRAGSYGRETITFPRSGTAAAPIVFRGYRDSPGDSPVSSYQVGDPSLNPADMPLLDGGDKTGTALYLEGRQYIEIHNLAIQAFEAGVNTYGNDHITLENLTVINCNPAGTAYVGVGIKVSGNFNTVRGCTVTDAGAENLMLYGSHNLAENCRSYGYSDDNATDYYLNVAPGPDGTGDYNVVRGCLAHRVNDLSHGGHGIGTKGDTRYNQFVDCEAINFAGEDFLVRHSGSAYNEFTRCVARGGTGIVIRDGAHDNTFRDCRLLDVGVGVQTFDSAEDGFHGAGFRNLIVDSIFTNAETMIDLDPFGNPDSAAFNDNRFVNCNFVHATNLITPGHESSRNVFTNCIFTEIANLTGSGGFVPGFSYVASDFWANGFPLPSGSGLLAADPAFVDPATGDYHLAAGSPCIDAGTVDHAPATDLDDHPRPQGAGVDVGAYEYPYACSLRAPGECRRPAASRASQLTMKTTGRARLTWKWTHGDASIGELGDPTASTDWVLCVGDATTRESWTSLPALAGRTCAGLPCWRRAGARGFRYVDRKGNAAGLASLRLTGGPSGAARFVATGGGAPLRLPTLPLALPAVVQLQRRDGLCWEATYSESGVVRNDPAVAKAWSE